MKNKIKKVIFQSDALKRYNYWVSINNKKILNKIRILINDIKERPFTWLGKPEALKNELSGYCSRRIDQEHRLIYIVKDMKL